MLHGQIIILIIILMFLFSYLKDFLKYSTKAALDCKEIEVGH